MLLKITTDPWRFLPRACLAVGLVSGLVGLYALRQNNLGMIRLREAVYQADQSGGDTEKALRELRTYVHSHMNTDLSSGGNAIKPPIQLKYRYERLMAAEKERVKSANAGVYTQAQAYCERQNQGFSGRNRVPCIEAYVTANGIKENAIPEALYKFDFLSPGWSPDLAGWSLVVSAASLAAGLLLWLLGRWRQRSAAGPDGWPYVKNGRTFIRRGRFWL